MSTDAAAEKLSTEIREMGAMDGATSNSKGCPEMPPEQPYNPNESVEYAEKAAKAMGMDKQCVEVAKNISAQSSSASSASGAMVIVTPMGGGGGGFSSQSKESTSFVDTSMTKQGCQKISNTMNQMKMEQISMTCNMNKTLSEQSGSAIGNNSLKIETIPPSGPAAVIIGERIAALTENIRLANETYTTTELNDKSGDYLLKLAMAGVSVEIQAIASKSIENILQQKLAALQNIIDMNTRLLSEYQQGNPLDASIVDSTIVQKINSKMKLASTQKIDSTAKTAMKASMKRLAKSVALDKINTEIGPGGARDAAREMITNKLDESMKREDRNIEETITENSMKVTSGNVIVLSVKGGIEGADISQSITSQVSVTVQQSIKKGVEIGKEVATEVITDTIKQNLEDRTSKGLDAVIDAAAAGNTAAIEAAELEGLGDIMKGAGEGVGAAAKGVGEGVGAAGEGLGKGVGAAGEGIGKGVGSALGGAMIPFIIIGVLLIGGFFLFPKLVPKLVAMSGASPGMIKMVGGGVLLLVVGLIVFFYIIPAFTGGGKESRRQFYVNSQAPKQAVPPVNTQAMNSPYARVEPRNFKGNRSARKLPSYKKINQYFRSPTEKVHSTSYNVNQASKNISSVNKPSYHFQNRVENKPVMYSKKSAYKN